ncbi:MAG TPA: hypothetical protein VFC35_02270 [Gemmatimonadaceae bacterium]|nr:hypothetical protein [Gemmatimonadaceae bacterium]
MSDELRFPGPSGSADRDSLGEPLTGLVRDAYLPASPADSDAYWAGFEQRIMARVKTAGTDDSGWLSVLAPWARAGLVAAAAVFAIASVIDKRISESESQYAYESVVPVSAPTSALSDALVSGQDRATGTDATLEYVLSH